MLCTGALLTNCLACAPQPLAQDLSDKTCYYLTSNISFVKLDFVSANTWISSLFLTSVSVQQELTETLTVIHLPC